MGNLGNKKGRLPLCRQPFFHLKGLGFIQPLLDVQPDIRLTAAVAADGMTFGFAFTFSHDTRRRFGCFLFFQGAGDNHFGFVAAVFALAYLLEFLFRHEISS
jgi:hypothetical protein